MKKLQDITTEAGRVLVSRVINCAASMCGEEAVALDKNWQPVTDNKLPVIRFTFGSCSILVAQPGEPWRVGYSAGSAPLTMTDYENNIDLVDAVVWDHVVKALAQCDVEMEVKGREPTERWSYSSLPPP